jgi:stage III sporulation protein AB
MLQQVQTEIDYGLTPMPELMERLAQQQDEPVCGFADRVLVQLQRGAALRDAWQEALRATYPLTALRPADLEPLVALGRVLGTSHVEDQVKHLKLAMDRIEHNLEAALAERDRDARLYSYLGVIASVALVIALM